MMTEQYHEYQRLLAGYLYDIAKIGEGKTLQIMFMLKTKDQLLTMTDEIYKHKSGSLSS